MANRIGKRRQDTQPGLRLKPGREISVKRRHPWIFAGALAGLPDPGSRGEATAVHTHEGALLGRGFLSPACPIAMRVWRFEDGPVDAPFVTTLVERAVALRTALLDSGTDGYRVINAEGDFLPGLVVDRFGSVLAVQATTAGTEVARPLWLEALRASFPGMPIIQKNDLPSRAGEGLSTNDEVLEGPAVPSRVPFREHGLEFLADLEKGQKTGFFLDQRENRLLVRRLSSGRRVLNLFSYSGAFGVAAFAGGAAHVTQVDISADALTLARENHAANGQATEGETCSVTFVEADVFTDLRERNARGEKWDLIVTDPPAFAKKRDDVERAARGYKDINRLAMKLMAPGGLLLACSCSGPVSSDLFQKILFGAALDAGERMQILEQRGPGIDHPVSLDCPEGSYLKAFLLRRP